MIKRLLFCLIILLFSQSSFALELVYLLNRQVTNYCAPVNGWCGLTVGVDRGSACSKLRQLLQSTYGFDSGHHAVSDCSGYYYPAVCDNNVGYCEPSDSVMYSQTPLAIASITEETYCPDNSGPHDSTTCECNTGFVANTAKTACEPPPNEEACPTGTHHSTGMFDWGLVKSHDKARVCDPATQCYLIFEGGNKGKTATVGGETHFFAVGSYYHLGSKCTPSSTNGVPLAMTSPPVESCGLNQVAITSTTGKLNCYKSDGTKVGASSSVPAAQSAADIAAKAAAIEQAALDAGESAADAVKNAGGDQAAQDKAKQDAVAQTVARMMSGGSSGGSDTAPTSGQNPISEYCQTNPDAQMCKEQDFGDVPDTVDLTDKQVNVGINPIAFGSAGVCPAPQVVNISGHDVQIPYDTFCNFASAIKPVLLLLSWLAAAGILIGGFKTA